MPTLTTYFLTVFSTNRGYTYPSGITNRNPNALWSWIGFPNGSRPTANNGVNINPGTPNPTVIQANDTSYMTYDLDAASYPATQAASSWSLLNQFTDHLDLFNPAVKPNLAWTITNVTLSVRKVASDDGAGTYARVFDSYVMYVPNGTPTNVRLEKLGLWPQTYTTYNYDLSQGLSAAQIATLYNPANWQGTNRTNIRFAAGFDIASVAKNLFTWGIDSILITFTYTLPSIAPYPIGGFFQPGFHVLAPQPVVLRPYSVKSPETVNPRITAPGTRLNTSSRIQAYPLLSFELLGRHRLAPGNVNIQPYSIKTLQNVNIHRLTALLNLQYRSIYTTEKIGYHRLYAQSYINPYSVQTIENKINYEPVVLPDGTNTFPLPSIRASAYIYPYSVKPTEKLGLNTLYSQAYIYPYSQVTTEKLGYDRLYAQAYIYPYSINNDEKLGINTLRTQAFIIPYPINTVEKTGLHILRTEAFIRPYPVTTTEILGLHKFLYNSYIYPYSIISEEHLGLHELQRQIKTLSFLNQIHYPSYEMGYYDCVALTRDINNDPYYDLSFATLNSDYMFSINNMNLNYKQNSNFDKRLAGEGASPNTFKIDKREFSFDFSLPVKIESWGDVDPVFAALYDYCIQGYKGSTSNFVGRILADNNSVAIGSTDRFVIDNISDFQSLGAGYTAYIKSDNNVETSESLIVSSVDKATKTIIFTTNTVNAHTPAVSYIWASSANPVDNREPSFSLFSAKEGLFSGCLVDSISLRIVPGENIIANIGIKFTDLDRTYQKNFFSNFNTIMANMNNRKPNYLLSSSTVTVSNSIASTSTYTFNLGDANSSKLFHGYQEYDLRDFEITEMTIDIKNNLQPIYSLNSNSSDTIENFNKNLQPYAYYSDGRSISGTIKYNSPMKPWLLAERLSGPSNINKSGILFNFGPFKLELPQVTWSPDSTNSTVESVQNKSVSWSVVVDSTSYDPYPEPTGEL